MSNVEIIIYLAAIVTGFFAIIVPICLVLSIVGFAVFSRYYSWIAEGTCKALERLLRGERG